MSNPTVKLQRLRHPVLGERLAVQVNDAPLRDVTRRFGSLRAWLQGSVGRVGFAIADLAAAADDGSSIYPEEMTPLPPVDEQEIWGAGVTYTRSAAFQAEALERGDLYARVYAAPRPELFFKAHARQVVASGDAVGIRRDALQSVPEPELALLLNGAMEIVGYTLGNDMGSRDIEGDNPLYMAQAKVYNRSCALGPLVVLQPLVEWPLLTLRITIERDGAIIYAGEAQTRNMCRTPAELAGYLGRCLDFPSGVVLLTGAGVAPGGAFTLIAGDRVVVEAAGVGVLSNTVMVV